MSDTNPANQLQVILTEQNVGAENAKQLLEAFGAPFKEAGEILADYDLIVVTDISQTELMATARTKRLALKEVRVSVEKKRKELKEDSLRTGRAIDSVARFVKDTVEPAEKYLQLQEDFAKIKEVERLEKLRADRLERLSEHTNTPGLYNYMDITDEQFDEVIAGLKRSKEAEAAAALKAEQERIAAEKAEAERQKKIQAENARLKREAAARDKQEAEERKAREDQEAARRAEQAKKDAAARAEAERIQREADAKLEAEQAKREKLEREQQEKDAAEAKKLADAEAAKRQAELAPDKEKLLAFADSLEKIELPDLSSEEARAVLGLAVASLEAIPKYIRGNVAGL
jgi:hypothetical protein